MLSNITKLLQSQNRSDITLGLLLLKKHKWKFNIVKWFEWLLDFCLIIPFFMKVNSNFFEDITTCRISSIEYIYFKNTMHGSSVISFSDTYTMWDGSRQFQPNFSGIFFCFIYSRIKRSKNLKKKGFLSDYF